MICNKHKNDSDKLHIQKILIFSELNRSKKQLSLFENYMKNKLNYVCIRQNSYHFCDLKSSNILFIFSCMHKIASYVKLSFDLNSCGNYMTLDLYEKNGISYFKRLKVYPHILYDTILKIVENNDKLFSNNLNFE